MPRGARRLPDAFVERIRAADLLAARRRLHDRRGAARAGADRPAAGGRARQRGHRRAAPAAAGRARRARRAARASRWCTTPGRGRPAGAACGAGSANRRRGGVRPLATCRCTSAPPTASRSSTPAARPSAAGPPRTRWGWRSVEGSAIEFGLITASLRPWTWTSLRRHRRLRSQRPARPARHAGPARRRPPAVRLRRGHPAPAVRSTGLVELEDIFITHFHADHVLGLPGMLKTFALRQRERPLTVYGPRGPARAVRRAAPDRRAGRLPARAGRARAQRRARARRLPDRRLRDRPRRRARSATRSSRTRARARSTPSAPRARRHAGPRLRAPPGGRDRRRRHARPGHGRAAARPPHRDRRRHGALRDDAPGRLRGRPARARGDLPRRGGRPRRRDPPLHRPPGGRAGRGGRRHACSRSPTSRPATAARRSATRPAPPSRTRSCRATSTASRCRSPSAASRTLVKASGARGRRALAQEVPSSRSVSLRPLEEEQVAGCRGHLQPRAADALVQRVAALARDHAVAVAGDDQRRAGDLREAVVGVVGQRRRDLSAVALARSWTSARLLLDERPSSSASTPSANANGASAACARPSRRSPSRTRDRPLGRGGRRARARSACSRARAGRRGPASRAPAPGRSCRPSDIPNTSARSMSRRVEQPDSVRGELRAVYGAGRDVDAPLPRLS